MDCQAVIGELKRHRTSLEGMGLAHLSLFGSAARGDATDASDIDLAVVLDERAEIDLFRFAAISDSLTRLLGQPVDLVVEPARNPRIQAEIDRDRLRVY